MSQTKLISLDNLTRYDGKIKELITTPATATPESIASSGAIGVSAKYAREDHTHAISVATGDANGQVKIAGQNASVKGLQNSAYNNTFVGTEDEWDNLTTEQKKAYDEYKITDDYVEPTDPTAEDISYDNTTSGLTADDVQDAIDEVNDRVGDLRDDMTDVVGWSRNVNLTENTYDNANINNLGVLVAEVDPVYSVGIAKVKSGETYVITTDDSSTVYAFFTEKPSINSVSYNNARYVESSRIFTAPINGYVAYRTSYKYATPQIEEGSTATTYEPYHAQVGVQAQGLADAIGWDNHKNLCPISSVNFTIESSNSWRSLNGVDASTYTNGTKVHLLAGTYFARAINASNVATFQVIDSSGSAIVNDLYSGGSFTLSSEQDVYVRIKTESGSVATTANVQIEKGNAYTSFQPYHPVIGEAVNELLTDAIGTYDVIGIFQNALLYNNVYGNAFVTGFNPSKHTVTINSAKLLDGTSLTLTANPSTTKKGTIGFFTSSSSALGMLVFVNVTIS